MQFLLTSIFLALRIVLPGLCWAWCLPLSELEGSRAGRLLLNTARTLVVGVAANAGLVMLLAEASVFSPGVDIAAWMGLSFIGLAGGLVRRRSLFLRYVKDSPWIFTFALVLFGFALGVPGRGEWLMGGWDPGVYQNQGIHVAKTGTFHPDPVPVYADMTDDEFMYFTRGYESYREVFPGIPIDRETRSYRHYFFRLTPAMTALLHRIGGTQAATRVNLVLAPVALLGLTAVAFALTASWSLALPLAILLGLAPVFVYHTHIPTSEMLHLVLMSGIGLSLYGRSRRPAALAALCAFLMLAVMNRLAFLPFAGMLLAIMAWLDVPRTNRWRCCVEHLAVALAVFAAALFDIKVCAVTLLRLKDVTPTLGGIFLAGVAAAICIDLLALGERLRRRLDTLLTACLRWGMAVMLTAGGAVYVVSLFPSVATRLQDGSAVAARTGNILHLAGGLTPFLGHLTVLGALAGGALVVRQARAMPRELFGWCVFGAAATVALVTGPHIADIFPWALRRFVPYTLPMIVLLNAWWLKTLWSARLPGLGRHGGRSLPEPRAYPNTIWVRVMAVCGLAVLLAGQAPRTVRAWKLTEYRGMSSVIKDLAARIETNDLVVVDSPQWATPLALTAGKQVLNGKRLWHQQDKKDMERGLDALRRLSQRGYRILFLTTTEEALRVYPYLPANITPYGDSRRASLSSIIHSARAQDFASRPEDFVLQLYTWRSD